MLGSFALILGSSGTFYGDFAIARVVMPVAVVFIVYARCLNLAFTRVFISIAEVIVGISWILGSLLATFIMFLL